MRPAIPAGVLATRRGNADAGGTAARSRWAALTSMPMKHSMGGLQARTMVAQCRPDRGNETGAGLVQAVVRDLDPVRRNRPFPRSPRSTLRAWRPEGRCGAG